MVANENGMLVQYVKDFVANKIRKNYYEVLGLNDCYCTPDRFLQELTREQLEGLKVLREKYGDDEFYNHLEEVFTDPDELHDLSCGEEIVGLDLDKIYHKYEFARHDFIKGEMVRVPILLEMNDEDYVRLLTLCVEDGGMNMNKLKYADFSSYKKLMWKVDYTTCDDDFYEWNYPFFVTFDELKADAEQIVSQNPEFRSSGTCGYSLIVS